MFVDVWKDFIECICLKNVINVGLDWNVIMNMLFWDLDIGGNGEMRYIENVIVFFV